MKILVINLERRKDRLDMMQVQLRNHPFEVIKAVDGNELDMSNIQYFKDWIDPLNDRPHTKGEIATSLSHLKAWEFASIQSEPCIILEDDCELVGDLDGTLSKLDKLMLNADLLYLGYREMYKEKITQDGDLIKPYYPYLGHSYVVTPELAKRLVASEFKNTLIPVDEFFPIINGVDFDNDCLTTIKQIKNNFKHLSNILNIGDVRVRALPEPVFNQYSRSIMGSDIETSSSLGSNYVMLTIGTDRSKMDALYTTSNRFNVNLVNLGEGVDWYGGNMAQGTGGGQKVNLVKKYLESVPDGKVIVFVDGYDVMMFNNIERALSRFRYYDTDILFAAEKTCWPDPGLADKFTGDTPYKYLNSGCYIGYAKYLREFFSEDITDSEDDQLYMQRRFLSTNLDVQLDSKNEIFTCLNGTEEFLECNFGKRLINRETSTDPIFLHGNGGVNQKNIFHNVFVDLFGTDAIEFADTDRMNVIIPDVLTSTFLTSKDCDYIIHKAELRGKWESLPGDKFPGQEVRLKVVDVDLFNKIVKRFEEIVVPIAEKYWFPVQYYGIRDMFIIKYDENTQSSLSCHHDASLFSGLIKLNDTYEGGDTYFHRQKFSNENIPKGDIIVWPGQVTHGHEGRKVTSGTKYNLVIWTSRYNGDVNG